MKGIPVERPQCEDYGRSLGERQCSRLTLCVSQKCVYVWEGGNYPRQAPATGQPTRELQHSVQEHAAPVRAIHGSQTYYSTNLCERQATRWISTAFFDFFLLLFFSCEAPLAPSSAVGAAWSASSPSSPASTMCSDSFPKSTAHVPIHCNPIGEGGHVGQGQGI